MTTKARRLLLPVLCILAGLLLFPATALDCPHHTTHTDACGYAPAQPETLCSHLHDESCYQLFTAEEGSVTQLLNCPHSHTDACGYRPALPESPCTYTCPDCLPAEENLFTPFASPVPEPTETSFQPFALDYPFYIFTEDYSIDGEYASLDDAMEEALEYGETTFCVTLLESLDSLRIDPLYEATIYLDLSGFSINTLTITGAADMVIQGGPVGDLSIDSGFLVLDCPAESIAFGGTAYPMTIGRSVTKPIAITAPVYTAFALADADPGLFLPSNTNQKVFSTDSGLQLCDHSRLTFSADGLIITAVCPCGNSCALSLDDAGNAVATGLLANADYTCDKVLTSPGEYSVTLSCGGYTLTRTVTCAHPDLTCTADPDNYAINASCGCGLSGTLTLDEEGALVSSGDLSSLIICTYVRPSDAPGTHTATLAWDRDPACTVSREYTILCPHTNLTYAQEAAVITAQCQTCPETGAITLNPDYTVTKSGLLEQAEVPDPVIPEITESTEYFVTLTYQNLTVSQPYTIPLTEAMFSLADSLTYNGEPQTQTVASAISDTFYTLSGSTNTNPGEYTLTISANPPYTGTLTIPYTIAKSSAYSLSPAFAEEQRIPIGAAAIQQPAFLGLKGEPVEGTLTYDPALPQAFTQSGTHAYTFTPASASLYTGDYTGQLTIEVAVPTFEARKNQYVTAPDTAAYGDNPIVTLNAITAVLGASRDSDPNHFRIVYSSDPLVIGANSYTVLYSGTLDGLVFQNVEVTSGSFTLTRGDSVFTQMPAAPDLTYTGQPQNLVIPGTSNSGPVTYSLDPNGPYREMVQATGAGTYKVYYAIEGDAYHDPSRSGYLTVTIKPAMPQLPALTATYGQRLCDIALPSGFSWDENRQDPALQTVGSVANPNTCYLSYTSSDPNIQSLLSEPIQLTVLPKAITPTASLSQTAFLYTGAENKPAADVFDGTGELPESDYTLSYSNNITPGTATVTISPAAGGNHTFEPLSQTFIIFSRRLKMTALGTMVPAELLPLLPDHDARACYEVTNQYSTDGITWTDSTDLRFLPTADFPVKIPYPAGTGKETHTFQAVARYTLPVQHQGIPAGKLTTLDVKQEKDLLSVILPTTAVLCLTWEHVPVSYSIDLMKDSQGNVHLSAEEAQPGTPVTILTQPRWSSYELSTLRVLSDSGETLSPTAVGAGAYTFTMPASDVTVIASFSPKSDNPKTADPIYAVVLLCLSSFAVLTFLYLGKLRKEQ